MTENIGAQWDAVDKAETQAIAALPGKVALTLAPRGEDFGADRVVDGTTRKGQLEGDVGGLRVRHYVFDADRQPGEMQFDLRPGSDTRLRNGRPQRSTDGKVRVFEFDHGADSGFQLTVMWVPSAAATEVVKVTIPKA